MYCSLNFCTKKFRVWLPSSFFSKRKSRLSLTTPSWGELGQFLKIFYFQIFKKLITCWILYTYAVNMISKLNVYLHYSTRVLSFYSWTFFEFLYNLHCIFNINPVITILLVTT